MIRSVTRTLVLVSLGIPFRRPCRRPGQTGIRIKAGRDGS